MTTASKKRTEDELLAMLRARHTKTGNGGAGEYAFLTHVRNAAGFDASRTIDALALSLWPSRGLELHGFEVKTSRSDWLRELKEPGKAESFVARCDRFWLVTGDDTVVEAGELPPTWGHMTARGTKLVVKVQAPKLEPTLPVDRSFLVCLLRAAGAVPTSTPTELLEARQAGRDEANRSFERERDNLRAEAQFARDEVAANRKLVESVEAALKVSIVSWRREWPRVDRDRVVTALRAVLAGDEAVERVTRALHDARAKLTAGVEHLDRLLDVERPTS